MREILSFEHRYRAPPIPIQKLKYHGFCTLDAETLAARQNDAVTNKLTTPNVFIDYRIHFAARQAFPHPVCRSHHETLSLEWKVKSEKFLH